MVPACKLRADLNNGGTGELVALRPGDASLDQPLLFLVDRVAVLCMHLPSQHTVVTEEEDENKLQPPITL